MADWIPDKVDSDWMPDKPETSLGVGDVSWIPDKPSNPLTIPKKPSGFLRRGVGDVAVSALKGAISLPEAFVGIADIPTLGVAGKVVKGLGIDFKGTKEELDKWLSPEQQQLNREVQEAEGFLQTIGAMLKRPSTVAHAVIESAPSMIGGGAIGRGLLKVAPKIGAVIGGAIGEGAISGGQTAEQVRQLAEGGILTPKQAITGAVSGALTGVIGALGGRLAKRLNIVDAETLMAGGSLDAVVDSVTLMRKKSILRNLAESALMEGAVEELPQSAQEQILQNVSLGKPWQEDVANTAASGMLVGGVMGIAGGAGGRVLSKGQLPTPIQESLKTDPLAKEVETQMAGLKEESEAIKVTPSTQVEKVVTEPTQKVPIIEPTQKVPPEPPQAPPPEPPVLPPKVPPEPPIEGGRPTLGTLPAVKVEPTVTPELAGKVEGATSGGTKIVNESGEPLVVYHGTDKPEFDVFKPGWREPAIFLTPVEENAWKYAKGVGTPSPTARVEKMTVDIRNPLIVEGRTGTNDLFPITEAKINELKAQGYDGIVSILPGGKIEHAREIIPFAPEQIKRVSPSPLPEAGKVAEVSPVEKPNLESLRQEASQIEKKRREGTSTQAERDRLQEILNTPDLYPKIDQARTREDILSEIKEDTQTLEDHKQSLLDAEGDPDALSEIKENIRDTKEGIALLKKELKAEQSTQVEKQGTKLPANVNFGGRIQETDAAVLVDKARILRSERVIEGKKELNSLGREGISALAEKARGGDFESLNKLDSLLSDVSNGPGNFHTKNNWTADNYVTALDRYFPEGKGTITVREKIAEKKAEKGIKATEVKGEVPPERSKDVSPTLIEYLTREVFKGKTLDSAVNLVYKKFNNAENVLLGKGRIQFTKEQLKQAYINDKVKSYYKQGIPEEIGYIANKFKIPEEELPVFLEGGKTIPEIAKIEAKPEVGVTTETLRQTQESIAADKITQAPSYQKLLNAYKRFSKRLYGSGFNEVAFDKKLAEEPWSLLTAHSGVMDAKSQTAKTLRNLADAVFKETGLPRNPQGQFRGMNGIDWSKIKTAEMPGVGKEEGKGIADLRAKIAEGKKGGTILYSGIDPTLITDMMKTISAKTTEIIESTKSPPGVVKGVKDSLDAMIEHDRNIRRAEFTSKLLEKTVQDIVPKPDRQILMVHAYENKMQGKYWDQLTEIEKGVVRWAGQEKNKLNKYIGDNNILEMMKSSDVNHIFHHWINPETGEPYKAMYGKFSKGLPQAKQRTIPTYEIGIEKGMTPATTNIGKLIGMEWESAVRANNARQLVKVLHGVKGDAEMSITLRKGKSPQPIRMVERWDLLEKQGLTDGYIRYDSPFLDKAITFESSDGRLVTLKGAVGVREELHPYVRSYVENPQYGTLSELNFAAKSLKLGASLFHPVSLGMQELANIRIPFVHIPKGIRITKELGPVVGLLHQEGLELFKGYEDLNYRNQFFDNGSTLGKTGNVLTWPITKMRDFIFNYVQPGMKVSFADMQFRKMLPQYLKGTGYTLEDITKLYEEGKPVPPEVLKLARDVVQKADGHFSGEHYKRSLLETNRFMVKLYFTPEARRRWQAALLSPTWQREHLLVAKNVAKSFMPDSMIRKLHLSEMGPIKSQYRRYLLGGIMIIGAVDLWNYMATQEMDGKGKHLWENPPGKGFAVRGWWDEPSYTITTKKGEKRHIKGGPAYIRPLKSLFEIAEWVHDPFLKIAYKFSPVITAIGEQFWGQKKYTGLPDIPERIWDFVTDVTTPIVVGQGIETLKGRKSWQGTALPFVGMPVSKLKEKNISKNLESMKD